MFERPIGADMFMGLGECFQSFAKISEGLKKKVTVAEYTPKRILKSGNATIVFWKDDAKTVVKCGKDEVPDDYDTFTAALAIKIFGSNSKLKKVIQDKTEIQEQKGKVK